MPARAMEIQLVAAGFDAGIQKIDLLAQSYTRLAAAQKQVSLGQPGSVNPIGAGGQPFRFLSGPNQKLQQIAQQMQIAEAQGNTAAQADLEILRFRAQRSKILGERRLAQGDTALHQPGLLDLFQDLNRLMRGGSGFGSLATAFRTLPAFSGVAAAASAGSSAGGGSAAAGTALSLMLLRLAGPLGLAAAGVLLLAKAAHAGAEAVTAIRQAATISGGSIGDLAHLTAAGVPVGQIAGLGAQLRSRLATDPLAMGIGGFAIPHEFGGSNDARLLQQQVERLRGVRQLAGAEEQLRQARILGLETILDQINVSEKAAQDQKRDAALRERIANPQYLQASRDYEAQLRRIGAGWQTLGLQIDQSLVGIKAFLSKSIADYLQLTVRAGELGQTLADRVNEFLSGKPAGSLGRSRQSGMSAHEPGQISAHPVNDNTTALKELSSILRRGISRGPRSDRAVPIALRAEAMRRAWEGQTLGAGAYRL